jgi:hypothetical protein
LDDAGLKKLQKITSELLPSSYPPELYRALFGVFERFPDPNNTPAARTRAIGLVNYQKRAQPSVPPDGGLDPI